MRLLLYIAIVLTGLASGSLLSLKMERYRSNSNIHPSGHEDRFKTSEGTSTVGPQSDDNAILMSVMEDHDIHNSTPLETLQQLLTSGGEADPRAIRVLLKKAFATDIGGTWRWITQEHKKLSASAYDNLISQAEYSQRPYLNPGRVNDIEQWEDPSGVGQRLQLEASAPGRLAKMETDFKEGRLDSSYYTFLANIPISRDWSGTVEFLDKQEVPSAAKSELIDTAVDRWTQSKDKDAAYVWLKDQDPKPQYEAAYSSFVVQSAAEYPERARQIFARLNDSNIKLSTVYDVASRIGEEKARQMLVTPETSVSDRNLIEKALATTR